MDDLLLVIVLVNAADVGLLFVLAEVDVPEREIGGVLGQNPVLIRPGQTDPVDLFSPLRDKSVKPQLLIERGVQFGALRLEQSGVFDGLADVPAGHVVGKGIVVDVLLELIRADHVVHVKQPVLAGLQSAQPEFRTVEDQLVTVPVHIVLIARADVVLPDAKGHVGGDVDLDQAAPDLGGKAGENVRAQILRRHLAVVQPRALPRKLRALKPVVRRLFVCAGQGEIAVFLQTPGNLGHGKNKIGQQEDLRIPEGVALVALAAESFCADVHAPVVGGRHQLHVILGKADREQVVVRSVDLNGGAAPDLFLPAGRRIRCEAVKAHGLVLFQRVQRQGLQRLNRQAFRLLIPAGVDIGKLLHHEGLPRSECKREDGEHAAAEDVDVAFRGDRRAVHRETVGRVQHEGDIRLDRARGKLQVLLVIKAGLSLGKVLGAVVCLPSVYPGLQKDAGILLRGEGHAQSDAVSAPERDHALKTERIRFPRPGAPAYVSGEKAGADIEAALVGEDLPLRQVEALPVQRQLDIGHVRGVRQLRYLFCGETVKGPGDKQIPRLQRIALFCGGAQAEIAVAQAEICFHLSQRRGVKIGLRKDPITDSTEIQHGMVLLFQHILCLLRKTVRMCFFLSGSSQSRMTPTPSSISIFVP